MRRNSLSAAFAAISTKKKPVTQCAAANDDEDLGSLFKSVPERLRKGTPAQKKSPSRKRSRSQKRSRSPKRSHSRKKSSSQKKSHSRNRSKSRKKSRSRKRSRSQKKSRSHKRSRSQKKSRSRKRSKSLKNFSRKRSRSQKKSRSRKRSRSQKRSRSRKRSRSHRNCSRKRSRSQKRSRSRKRSRSHKKKSISQKRSRSRQRSRSKKKSRSLKRSRSRKSESAVVAGDNPALSVTKAKQEPDTPAPRKAKKFAWMDSEDEDGADEGDEDDEEQEPKKEGGEETEKKDSDEDVEVSIETLDEAQSFGRMMLLAPTLQKRLRGFGVDPLLVVAACRALARTKFFDSDILEDLYRVLCKLIQTEKLDVTQTNDAVQCLWTLNAYDCKVFRAVAAAFQSKTASMDTGMRATWLEVFKSFGHAADKGFLQLLEVPAVPPMHPSYRKVRCRHHARGECALAAACSFSHDHRAPHSLTDGGNEDWWRSKPLVMTQNQKTMGRGVYGETGLGKNFVINQ